jgi:ribosomal protein S18 acetylase RimI-like enzyme
MPVSNTRRTAADDSEVPAHGRGARPYRSRSMALKIVDFSDEWLDEAGQMLAERHRRQRTVEPLLAERFEDASTARVEIEALWRSEGASGTVAVDRERAVGYLIGAPRADAGWGANVWIEFAGHAVAEGEIVRDLYARAAQRWVEDGRGDHYALVPATDAALVDAWFRLSFGQQHAHAVREVPAAVTASPRGIEIRRIELADLDAIVELDAILPTHTRRSPVFAFGAPRPSPDEIRADWQTGIDNDSEGCFICEHERTPVGLLAIVPVEVSRATTGLGRPDKACILGFAATAEAARGTGVGLALTNAAFAWAHEHGYETIVTDWRVTNLLASRFWPKRGFRTTFLRLYRSIPLDGRPDGSPH